MMFSLFFSLGHRFRPAYEFDYVALDLLGVYPEDSGVYTCQARNQLGEAVTSCAVKIIGKLKGNYSSFISLKVTIHNSFSISGSYC